MEISNSLGKTRKQVRSESRPGEPVPGGGHGAESGTHGAPREHRSMNTGSAPKTPCCPWMCPCGWKVRLALEDLHGPHPHQAAGTGCFLWAWAQDMARGESATAWPGGHACLWYPVPSVSICRPGHCPRLGPKGSAFRDPCQLGAVPRRWSFETGLAASPFRRNTAAHRAP